MLPPLRAVVSARRCCALDFLSFALSAAYAAAISARLIDFRQRFADAAIAD